MADVVHEIEPRSDLIAFAIGRRRMWIVPVPADREWMDSTPAAFANRCLPLRLANQAGWFLLNDQAVSVRWSGGPELADLQIELSNTERRAGVLSHFGNGIVTWHIPYIFRTPRGFSLRGSSRRLPIHDEREDDPPRRCLIL